MQDAKYIKDIKSYVDGIPYGTVQIEIERVNRHTVQTVTVGHETLRYVDNNECVKDILAFLTALLDDKHNGTVQFSVEMQNGQINLLTLKNTKRTKYQK